MKRLALGLTLFSVLVYGFLVLPQPTVADGSYYTNSGVWAVATDTGTLAVGDSTRDSIVVSTPVPAYRFNTLTAKFKLQAATPNRANWAASDRAIIRLRTSMGDGQLRTLDSINAAPPCSLFTNIPLWQDTTTAKAKSFFKDLRFDVILSDSVSDTALYTMYVPYYWEVIVRE